MRSITADNRRTQRLETRARASLSPKLRPTLRARTVVSCVAGLLLVTVLPTPAGAQSDFTPGPGSYTIDTTAVTIQGPGTNLSGEVIGGVAVFSFDKISIPLGANFVAKGGRPLKLVATRSLTLAGEIDGSGTTATDFVAGPYAGGPGGGAGGANGSQAGSGPGGGGVGATNNDGGGGGGFGGRGAQGGAQDLGPGGGIPGVKYGNLEKKFRGGSGGGGGSSVGGGGGGGAIALFGSSVTIAPSGVVRADGGHGTIGNFGASGGGSGGGIILHGDSVRVEGLVSAAGGSGGSGGCCGAGGGGGGGRISYQYRSSLTDSGTVDVSGGESGAHSTGGYSPGMIGPDAAGQAGVLKKIKAPNTKITSASINSNKRKATFGFKAVGQATGFQCALQKGTSKASFKACSSPKLYKRLKPGGYTFSVRAVGPAGSDPSPAKKSFKI